MRHPPKLNVLLIILSGPDEHLETMDNANQGMEISIESVQYNIWRQIAELLNPETHLYKIIYRAQRHVDKIDNLFLIVRNGMHRYNNADHSMLTAMVAVDNIIDLWISKFAC